MKKYKYILTYITPAMIVISLFQRGWGTYTAIIFSFILVPLIELFFKPDVANISIDEEDEYKTALFYDVVLYSMLPIHLFIMAVYLYQLTFSHLAMYEKIGMTTAFGISCGVLGINVAHELGHRTREYERTMAKILLWTTQYLHFFIEHNQGHHKNVSTDEDAASAKKGQNVFFFHFQSIIGGYFSAWNIENESLRRKNIATYSLKNRMICYHIAQLILIGLIVFFYGWAAMLYYILAVNIGIRLLETTNYIQHYGLRRAETSQGHERVQPAHSWNSNYPFGRILLFELSRHSDHHMIATKKYQLLKHIEHSPEMPTGYPGMMLLALIPPLWYRVMDKRISLYIESPKS